MSAGNPPGPASISSSFSVPSTVAASIRDCFLSTASPRADRSMASASRGVWRDTPAISVAASSSIAGPWRSAARRRSLAISAGG